MSQHESLLEILRSLPSENFQFEIDFIRKVVPRLTSILGYSEGETFYEYGGREYRADVVLAKSIESRPWIVIELKKGKPRNTGDWVFQVKRYLDSFNCKLGVVLSPQLLIIIDSSNTQEYDLNDLTPQKIIEIQAKLSRIAQNTPLSDTAPQKNRLGDLIERVERAETNDQKGKSLEEVTRFLFASTPELRCKYANLHTKSSEIDLVIEYDSSKGRIPLFEDTGRYCLVECKNWSKPVGVGPIRDFMGKIDKCRTRLGVIFSKNGVTGVNSGVDALREIQSRYDRDGVLVLVFSLEDLRAINDGRTFIEAIDRKADHIRFDT